MPRGDRTGPNGQGPMTGRGRGYCSGSDAPGIDAPGPGRGSGVGGGWGRGMGRGRGRRNLFFATGLPGWLRFGPFRADQTPGPDGEKQILENQAQALQSQLDRIRQRLDDLESKPAGK
jgi:hypothetical protein